MKEFITGTIVRTRYNEVGIVFYRVPLGYYLWTKDVSDTGFCPLYDRLSGAVELEITNTRNLKEIKEILNKYK